MSEENEAPAGDADIKSSESPAPEAEAEPKKKAARKASRRTRESKDDDRPAEARDSKDEAEKPADSKPSDDGEEGGGNRRGRGRRGGSGRNRKTASESRRTSTPVDPKELGKKAWQLYRADIAEEGLELVKDGDGQKLAKRSFDLAKIFLDERSRRAPRSD